MPDPVFEKKAIRASSAAIAALINQALEPPDEVLHRNMTVTRLDLTHLAAVQAVSPTSIRIDTASASEALPNADPRPAIPNEAASITAMTINGLAT